MKANLPPFDDGMVWCRWVNNGEGGYFPREECEYWHDGHWYPLQVTHLLRTIRGTTASEMDARTRDDTPRGRSNAVQEDVWPGL